MDFKLSEEQKSIQKMVRNFVEKEIRPKIDEYEEKEEFPWPLVKKAAELGLMGMVVPEKYDGIECDTVSYCLVTEEIAKASAGLALIISANNSLSSVPIVRHGNEEQKQKYLPGLATGEKLGCWAITESCSGSDVAGERASAKRDGDSWVLNGSKVFITNASVADICVGTFRTAKDPHKGLSAFIIEKGTPGFRVGKIEEKMGLRCSLTAELVFEDCRIPLANLLGKEGEGFKIVMDTLNAGRVNIAAQGLGVAEGAFELALKYAKEREQFGKPIAAFQMIQSILAEMAIEIEAARQLIYHTAWREDNNLPFEEYASMAKFFATEMAVRTTGNSLQIFGGYGYMKDYKIERLYRDAKVLTIYEGTSQIQKLIVARKLLGKGY